jgi:hypothetical protein
VKMFDEWSRVETFPAAPDVQFSNDPLNLIPEDIERLLNKMMDHLDTDPVKEANVFLIGFDPQVKLRMCDMLTQLDVATFAFGKIADFFSKTPAIVQKYSTIILNLDAVDDLIYAVDSLYSFRSRYPEIGVILVSSEVRGDDMGRERAAICDATLRTPLTTQRLKDALQTAISHTQEAIAES